MLLKKINTPKYMTVVFPVRLVTELTSDTNASLMGFLDEANRPITSFLEDLTGRIVTEVNKVIYYDVNAGAFDIYGNVVKRETSPRTVICPQFTCDDTTKDASTTSSSLEVETEYTLILESPVQYPKEVVGKDDDLLDDVFQEIILIYENALRRTVRAINITSLFTYGVKVVPQNLPVFTGKLGRYQIKSTSAAYASRHITQESAVDFLLQIV